MKTMKKLMALLLAAMMCMSLLSVAAFADDPEPGTTEPGTTEPGTTTTPAYDYPLTVTGLATGDTVKFYKIIEWVGETSDKSDVAGWKAVSPYSSVLDKDTLKAMLVGTPAAPAVPPATEGTPAVPATGMTSELAGQLAALATSGGVDPDTLTGGTATLNNATSGMWMAIVTPADANTVYNPVFVSADYNKETGHEGTAAVSGQFADGVAKSSTITLTKTAENAADYNSDNAKTTAVGDTVTFTVNTKIPAYGDVYTNPHFVLTDTLEDLQLKKDGDNYIVSLTAPTGLQIKDAEHATAGTYDYEINPSDGGYTITFAESYLKTVKTVTDVTVTYDAVVTSTATKAVNEEDNTVQIEYSHNPNNQSDYDVKKDTTQHYTFTLDASGMGEGQSVTGKKTSEIVKIGLDAAGNPITETTETSAITSTETWQGPLQDAVFGLWKNANCSGDPYKTATTGADGRLSFAGLDAGDYWLKEISAPAGYVTDTTVHTVNIAAETKSVSVTEYWNGTAWSAENPGNGAKSCTYDTDILESYTVTIDGQKAAEYKFKNADTASSTEIQWENAEATFVENPFELQNTKGTELPSTGGIGTKIFYTMGAVLVIGAGVVLVSRKRAAE